MKWSRVAPLDVKHLSKVPRISGIYRLHNAAGTPVYIGVSTDLRHRLHRHCEKLDPINRTENRMAGVIKKFTWAKASKKAARDYEAANKKSFKYNTG